MQASEVDWEVVGEKELKMFSEQGDVAMVRRVMQQMREREAASSSDDLAAQPSADSYLPLFEACANIKGESRVEKMEELLSEMEEQGIEPSAEVRRHEPQSGQQIYTYLNEL